MEEQERPRESDTPKAATALIPGKIGWLDSVMVSAAELFLVRREDGE